MARILIAGCGYVGTALGRRLAGLGHQVWGLRRRVSALPPEIRPVAADLDDPATLHELPARTDHVVYTAAADTRDDASYEAAYVRGLRNLLAALDRRSDEPRRVLFVSSTAVYAQSSGEWVDETSIAAPTHFSGRRLLEGERLLFQHRLCGAVVRFGGIYGPGRTRLIRDVLNGRALYPESPPVYGNRIHLDDAAGVLLHLMETERPDPLYLGVDSEPAPLYEVVRWLAGRLGVPVPAPSSGVSPQARGMRSNKRCRNARLLRSGYELTYPSYREGYADLLQERE